MLRMCCYCEKIMGEKEPFEDKSITSGLCDPCLKKELKKAGLFKQAMARRDQLRKQMGR